MAEEMKILIFEDTLFFPPLFLGVAWGIG